MHANVSRDSTAHPGRFAPPSRGRSGRKATHYDRTEPLHKSIATFRREVPGRVD